jgi:hypothetical protein
MVPLVSKLASNIQIRLAVKQLFMKMSDSRSQEQGGSLVDQFTVYKSPERLD